MCIHCCLYTFITADTLRGREQNVKRCRCRVSGVRNKQQGARSPRTCWHPKCPPPRRLRIVNMCPTWLAVFVQPTAPASTYEGRIPSKQPPEIMTPKQPPEMRKFEANRCLQAQNTSGQRFGFYFSGSQSMPSPLPSLRECHQRRGAVPTRRP